MKHTEVIKENFDALTDVQADKMMDLEVPEDFHGETSLKTGHVRQTGHVLPILGRQLC